MIRRSLICLVMAVVLASVTCLPCFATHELSLPEHSMTVQVPDQFTLIHKNNLAGQGDLLAEFGTTVTDTDLKFTQEGYLFLAISPSMRCTMFMSYGVSDVSATIGDLISYRDLPTARRLLLGDTMPETAVVKEIEQNGALFYRVDFGETEGAKRIAYFTVMNGKSYTLCMVDNNKEPSKNASEALDFTFENWQYTILAEAQKIDAFEDKVIRVIGWIAIPVLLIAAVYVLRLIVRDLQKRRLEENRRNIMPKKPRR